MSIKINFITRLQHWMDSVPGQTFLNYAYSWGAAIVILGALFKLTHLPGGNIMLFIGMGTEVVVFFLSAFDRPFDKEEVGKELPPDYETDEQIAARLGLVDDDDDEEYEENHAAEGSSAANSHARTTGTIPAGGTAIAGGAAGVAGTAVAGNGGGTVIIGNIGSAAGTPANSEAAIAAATQAAIAANTPAGEEPFDNEAKRLAAIIRTANDELLHRAQAVLSPEMESATQTYIQQLQTLAETFAKVDEQSARLTKDSEEMDNLNRTLTGINKVYELHLKSISLQVGTIDQINEQTQKLAQQIEDLNRVYGRMIEALTVNMRGTGAVAPNEK